MRGGSSLYTVLLVDDEHIVLDTLLNYVEWHKLSLNVIGTARNGKEAFDKVCSLHPDILITDIKMPIADGIKLASKVHQRFPEIQIVFLSGYNEFEYARSAINIGVAGYLMKPIDYPELTNVMKSVCQNCEEQKNKTSSSLPAAGEHLRELLQTNGALPTTLVKKTAAIFAQNIGMPLKHPEFHFTLITIDEYPLLSEYMQHIDTNSKTRITSRLETAIAKLPGICAGIITRLHEGHWLFISSKDCFLELSLWRGKSPYTKRWISIFQIERTSLKAFVQRYPHLRNQRKVYIAAKGPGLTINLIAKMPEDLMRRVPLPPTNALIEAIWNSQHEKVHIWLNDFYDNGIPEASIKQVFANTIDFFNQVQKKVIETNSNLRRIYEHDATFMGKLFIVESSHCMKTLATQIIMAIMAGLETQKNDRKNVIIHEISTIIEEHFAMPLSVEFLAEKVYLSPNYLSTIFKEGTGKTLLEYITDIRISEAVKMLLYTRKRIHEVAAAVGYESPSYFSSVFYRNKGLTPNQYRVLHQDNS